MVDGQPVAMECEIDTARRRSAHAGRAGTYGLSHINAWNARKRGHHAISHLVCPV
jgi:hypothetical protein